jgi:hypothetical protein
MKTFTRVCIKDFEIVDLGDRKLTLKSGEQYLTSEEKDGMVMVFTTFWVTVPAALFSYERISEFT